jgi:F0F1-type ATP synthase assembly protein I
MMSDRKPSSWIAADRADQLERENAELRAKLAAVAKVVEEMRVKAMKAEKYCEYGHAAAYTIAADMIAAALKGGTDG